MELVNVAFLVLALPTESLGARMVNSCACISLQLEIISFLPCVILLKLTLVPYSTLKIMVESLQLELADRQLDPKTPSDWDLNVPTWSMLMKRCASSDGVLSKLE